jgi:Flp pilus assembly protein TadD
VKPTGPTRWRYDEDEEDGYPMYPPGPPPWWGQGTLGRIPVVGPFLGWLVGTVAVLCFQMVHAVESLLRRPFPTPRAPDPTTEYWDYRRYFEDLGDVAPPPPPTAWRRVLYRCRATVGLVLDLMAGTVTLLFVGGLQAVEIIGQYCAQAWQTRQLVYGLPALAAGGTALGLWVASLLTLDDQLVKNYLREGDRAMKDRDWAVARTCYRKALSLGDTRPVLRFDLALCLEELGQRSGAEAMAKSLIDPQQAGYAPARMWRARHLLAEAPYSAAAMQEVVLQLQKAVQLEPNNLDAAAMLGMHFFKRGRTDDAEPYLHRAADAKPGLRLILAKYYLDRGDREEGHRQAQKVWDYYKSRAESGDETALVSCGQASIYLESPQAYLEAVQLLHRGREVHDSLAVRHSLAACYAALARAAGTGPQPNREAQLKLVQQGLHYSPADIGLLQSLLDLSNQTGKEGDEARAAWQKMITERAPQWIEHLLLGLDDWNHGKKQTARVHLEQAHRLSPESAWVANNLAWMLLKSDPPDLERALALADAAVKQAPDDSRFRDTRGQILLKQEKWQDALAELELALRGREDNPGVHEALAVAYEKLGMPDIAARHRRLAEPKTTKQ